MGSAFSKQKVKVLVVGLDNSGKTSILQWLRNQKSQNEVAPTVGYNMDTLEKNNLNFSFIDMSGQNQYRDMWEQYTNQIDAVIFVIDSADKLRFSVMANEYELLLQYQHIKSQPIPFLFYANKCDQQEAEDAAYFIDFLKLKNTTDRSWFLVGSSTKTGEGLEQGLTWLSHKLQQVKKK